VIAGRRSTLQTLSLIPFSHLLLTACEKPVEKLPSLVRLGGFRLTDHTGKEFTQQKLKGKIWLASFMFTRCPSTCPRMMRYLKKVQDAAKKRNVALHLVTFSVDPENDTPEVLRAFAQKFDVDLDTWTFLTGDIDVVKKTSVEGFKMSLEGQANPEAEGFGILHGSHLVLVDSQFQIRGYYPTKEETTLARLLKDAEALARS